MLTHQQMYPSIANPTYNAGRKCLHCGKLIPDQAHATREHCPQVKLNGENFDCKSEKNTLKDLPEDKRDREIIKHLRSIDKRIAEMHSHKGSIITWEDLDAYHIILSDSKTHQVKINGEMSWEFIYNRITLNPATQKLKIIIL